MTGWLHEVTVTVIKALAALLAWITGLAVIGAGFHYAEKFTAWRRRRELERRTRAKDESGELCTFGYCGMTGGGSRLSTISTRGSARGVPRGCAGSMGRTRTGISTRRRTG